LNACQITDKRRKWGVNRRRSICGTITPKPYPLVHQ
jgi:hypothetical protein